MDNNEEFDSLSTLKEEERRSRSGFCSADGRTDPTGVINSLSLVAAAAANS